MEKILPALLTTAIIKQAEGVGHNKALERFKEMKNVCGKAKPTIFQYFECSGFTPEDVAFSFGKTYAQRYAEAKNLGM